MKVSEIVAPLSLTVLSARAEDLEQDITGGYVSDLLSNVMGQAHAGNLWITLQGHQNIIAVASLSALSAVIVAGDAVVDEAAIEKAKEHQVVLMASSMPAFELAGRLYQLGIGAKG